MVGWGVSKERGRVMKEEKMEEERGKNAKERETKRMVTSVHLPDNILRPSRNLRVVVPGHIPAPPAAGGVHLPLQGWGLEGDEVEV